MNILCRISFGILATINQWIGWIRLRYFEFKPRPDDIFIVTYPRSGTTWMQMILYQLTTDGSMDIPHISKFIPFFERFAENGRDIESLPSPRILKTHLRYDAIRSVPKGPCRYIYLARDGKDVVVSYYHLYQNQMKFRGSFEQFFQMFIRGRVQWGSWFRHVSNWYEHRNDKNVLFLYYEDLIQDLAGSIKQVADFCGITIDPARFDQLVEMCRFDTMKKYEGKLEHITGLLYEDGYYLGEFIRKGQSGSGKVELSTAENAQFDAENGKWFSGKPYVELVSQDK